MKKLAAIVASVSIVLMATLAYGDMGGHGRGRGPRMTCGCGMDGPMMETDHHMSKYLMSLNLDEQQKTAIGEIKSTMRKETIKKTADMRIVHIELKDLLRQDPVDMKAVEDKVKQLETMNTEMLLSHIKAMEDCKSKLTPEQSKKLKEMIASEPMMEEMGMMKHKQERGKSKK